MKKYLNYLLCFMMVFGFSIISAKAITADGQCVPISGTTVSNYDGLQCTTDSSTVIVTAQKLSGNRGICCAGSAVSQDTTIGYNNIYTNENGTVTIHFDAVASSDTNTTTTSNTTDSSSSNTATDAFKFCDSNANPGVMAIFKLGSIALLIIKILVPIILIVLGMIDMAKAVVNDNQDAIKKNALTFARRVATGVLVFLAPTILLALFTFIDGWDSVDSAYKRCIDCLLDTSQCPKDVSITGTVTDDSTSSSSSDNTTGGSSTHVSDDGIVHGGSTGGF